MSINEAHGPRPKRPAGIRIRPDKMKHCLTCTRPTEFRSSPDDEDSIEDMTVKCVFFPNGDKTVGTGTDCRHHRSTFHTLKICLPQMISF